jgi:hypothetical protein
VALRVDDRPVTVTGTLSWVGAPSSIPYPVALVVALALTVLSALGLLVLIAGRHRAGQRLVPAKERAA